MSLEELATLEEELPAEIDVVAMSRRGQMGSYWVSVIGV